MLAPPVARPAAGCASAALTRGGGGVAFENEPEASAAVNVFRKLPAPVARLAPSCSSKAVKQRGFWPSKVMKSELKLTESPRAVSARRAPAVEPATPRRSPEKW